ncbi:hypothetical protein CSV73_12430 [Sporosarcina sp. P1]|nr:hypothetical protein CSV73_12430 [Sporosarcina sp. P1]
MFTFWTRAGTWGIASSHEPAGDGAASCLMATAYPAVVPALLWGNELVCVSNKKKNSDIVIHVFLSHFLLGTSLDLLLDSEVSECSLSRPAQARGGLPPAMSQLAMGLPVVSWPRPTPQLCPRYCGENELICVSNKRKTSAGVGAMESPLTLPAKLQPNAAYYARFTET